MVFHLLTAVLFLLKVLGVISISWWLVVAPSVAVIAFGLLVFIGVLIGACVAVRLE
jgi:hypothetical protein